MYLQKIQLENIKCYENLEINFRDKRNKPRLMTVILGDNGVGKTTLLQAIAITLRGGQESSSTLVTDQWVRVGTKQGYIEAIIHPGRSDTGGVKQKLEVKYLVTGDESIEIAGFFYDQSTISAMPSQDLQILRRTAYADHNEGWLACGYGPLRRFTDQRMSQVQDTKISRFDSIFGQNKRLIPIEDWLIELDRRALLEEREGLASNYRQMFNQLTWTLLRMLPEENIPQLETDFDIRITDPSKYVKTTTEQGILWLDSFDNWVRLSQLSDGYQSMMSWVGDLVSRLSRAFPNAKNFLDQEGIVLIDEVDIHLQPIWQRKILNQLRQTFPNIQFIVTTHSPLVAANAKEGELFVLKQEQNRAVVEPAASVQGWRSDQILTSDLFGLDTTRDPETESYLARYDELLALRAGEKWNPNLAQELTQLENILRQKLPPPGETLEQRQLQQKMEDFITQTLKLGKNK